MDQLKNLAGKLGNSSNSQTTNTGNTTGAGKQDPMDKAFGAAGKKFGYNGNPETNEKITDGIRGQFEKATGKKVPDKLSN